MEEVAGDQLRLLVAGSVPSQRLEGRELPIARLASEHPLRGPRRSVRPRGVGALANSGEKHQAIGHGQGFDLRVLSVSLHHLRKSVLWNVKSKRLPFSGFPLLLLSWDDWYEGVWWSASPIYTGREAREGAMTYLLRLSEVAKKPLSFLGSK